MKNFNGKALYNPSGKAGEYSYWACNFYVGCSNMCDYCYCRKGILAKAMGQEKPQLKKCFRDENHALQLFEKELMQNISELQTHGLFFSFTTDPLLYETKELTQQAVNLCLYNDVPVKLLTKKVDYIYQFAYELQCTDYNLSNVAFGFTLTGHDELEPYASSNAERIKAMQQLHKAGFKTFASIEPIIDFESSKEMIRKTAGYCDLYKIGLESGKKYVKHALLEFIEYCNLPYRSTNKAGFFRQTNYFKDGLLKQAGISRDELPENCVTRDYNIFEH